MRVEYIQVSIMKKKTANTLEKKEQNLAHHQAKNSPSIPLRLDERLVRRIPRALPYNPTTAQRERKKKSYSVWLLIRARSFRFSSALSALWIDPRSSCN